MFKDSGRDLEFRELEDEWRRGVAAETAVTRRVVEEHSEAAASCLVRTPHAKVPETEDEMWALRATRIAERLLIDSEPRSTVKQVSAREACRDGKGTSCTPVPLAPDTSLRGANPSRPRFS